MLQKIAEAWQSLTDLFRKEDNRPIAIPHTNDAVIIITAFVKKGIFTVSYKREDKRGYMDPMIMRNMMHNKDFDKNSFKFFHAVATLLSQLTKNQ